MKSKKLKKFLVGIFYQTPTGRAGATNIRVEAANETDAEKKAHKTFWKGKKGKGYKIQGGDISQLK